MTTTDRLIPDPITGEALDADQVAREWARLDQQVREAQAVVTELTAARDAIEPLAREACALLGRLDAGAGWVVLAPPARRPAVRLDANVAQEHAEELHALGLGRVGYIPPKASDVRARAAEVIAAGVPLDRLLPDPGPGREELRLVEKQP